MTETRSAPAPSPSSRWDEDRVHRELTEFLDGRTSWPTRTEFAQAGRYALWKAARRCGGLGAWAETFGLDQPRAGRRKWTHARIRDELDAFISVLGRFPTEEDFVAARRTGLRDAINTYGGRDQWALEMGIDVAPPGGRYAWSEERLRAELERFCLGRDRMPTDLEFAQARRTDLRKAMQSYGGRDWWAAELGLSTRRRGGQQRWTIESVRAALGAFVADRDRWPSRNEFRSAGRLELWAAAERHGGHGYWAQEFALPRWQRRSASALRARWTPPLIRKELTAFCDGRRTWPTRAEFAAAGLDGLRTAALRMQGVEHWAFELGLRVSPSGRPVRSLQNLRASASERPGLVGVAEDRR